MPAWAGLTQCGSVSPIGDFEDARLDDSYDQFPGQRTAEGDAYGALADGIPLEFLAKSLKYGPVQRIKAAVSLARSVSDNRFTQFEHGMP